MSDQKATAEQWAARVATMAVDALLDAGLVTRDQFEAAQAVVAEEVFARLCVHDYPPPVEDGPQDVHFGSTRAVVGEGEAPAEP